MKRKRKKWASIADDSISVPLSPLIDCVFLLLIFFLVTSMLKKMEKQIPIVLPDITSKIADEPDEQIHIIGLSKNGTYLANSGKKTWQGENQYYPLDNLGEYLKNIPLGLFNPKDFPIRIDADRDVSIQKIIDTLDICAIQGFENIQLYLLRDIYEPIQRQLRDSKRY